MYLVLITLSINDARLERAARPRHGPGSAKTRLCAGRSPILFSIQRDIAGISAWSSNSPTVC